MKPEVRSTAGSRQFAKVRGAGASSRPTGFDVARLVPLWPSELAGERREDRLRLLSRLRRALKDERRRGLCGHWAYDLARHAQLADAYRAELRRYLEDFGALPGLPGCAARATPTRKR